MDLSFLRFIFWWGGGGGGGESEKGFAKLFLCAAPTASAQSSSHRALPNAFQSEIKIRVTFSSKK